MYLFYGLLYYLDFSVLYYIKILFFSQVVLYNSNLTNLNNITGGQIGAYFGYSVASGDLNGDGLDDVIVGAPMWTNYEVMGKYETGRVYIVYQNAEVSCLLFVLTTGV